MVADESYHLSGMRAVVTGSSSGIGRAIASEFARAGSQVVVHANRSTEQAEAFAAELSEAGSTAVALQADLSDPKAGDRFIEEAFDALGGVDVWVNNAGADILTGETTERPYAQKLQILFELDVRSTILLTRSVGNRMNQQSDGGSIINIGWDQALTGMEGESGELFSATKGAVMAFTKSVALTMAPKVRVNCIAPGWIQTAWGKTASQKWQERVIRETPIGRWGKPENVAHAARFLASPAAGYMTGQTILVNGGAVR
ncbi:MAG: SDR family oxidoreductase [Planctomycetes bacterium]|nr:SDR family oxidoreductase [Planctomycetota bacterium]